MRLPVRYDNYLHVSRTYPHFVAQHSCGIAKVTWICVAVVEAAGAGAVA